jgi:hypothetical protein
LEAALAYLRRTHIRMVSVLVSVLLLVLVLVLVLVLAEVVR